MPTEEQSSIRSRQGLPQGGVELSLDELAKGLATGTLSRGKAIRWMGGALLGAALASVPGMAWADDDCRRLGRECRRDSQCCSRNCIRRGDAKVCGCPEGQRRCNDRCVNLDRNENHCGECFNRCDEGVECVEGVCGGEVCEGEFLTPVGGGDPICTCAGRCVASCDECEAGTICTIGPSECGNPPTLACSTPCGGEPICNPPCPQGRECVEGAPGFTFCQPICPSCACSCFDLPDGSGGACVACNGGCPAAPNNDCSRCETDFPGTICVLKPASTTDHLCCQPASPPPP
jgi:Stigma-specific protein, Stig1